jgi:hypothetical protein
MSKLSIEIKDVDFSRLTIKESSKNPNIFTMNYKFDDGTVKPLLIKTPFIDCNYSGLFFSTDKDGKPIEDKDRMQWRAYITDETVINKFKELEAVLEEQKSVFTGPVNTKDKKTKEFNVQSIIGEYTDKNGNVQQYVRLKFRTQKTDPSTFETPFFNMKGENMNINKLSEFEAQCIPREYRYRCVLSLYGWKMKSTYLFGTTFSIEQMQIEITKSSTNIKQLLKNVSLFDATTSTAIEEVDLSKHIENDEADDEAIVEAEENLNNQDEQEQEEHEEEDEDEEEEIRPSKKSATVKVTATKQVRKKASSSNA